MEAKESNKEEAAKDEDVLKDKIIDEEDGIQVRLMDRGQFWKTLMDYFFSDNIHKHGGGNTLKATTLAFQKLGWLELTGMTDRAYAKGS